MQLQNLVEFCAPGAGKTYGICKKTIELRDSCGYKSLIVTYTNKGKTAVETEFKKQNEGVLSSNVVIKTWFDFLLSEMIKPYQNYFLRTNQVSGIDFDKNHGFINKAKDSSPNRYIEKNGNLYPNEVSKLAIKLNACSNGLAVHGLSERFDAVFFDEIQDLAGYDLNLVEMLMESSIFIHCSGDYKQATYKTNNSNKNKSFSGKNCTAFFKGLEKKGLCVVTKNLVTRRCNAKICEFANEIFPTEESIVSNGGATTGHDGIFLILDKDVELYYSMFHPQLLVYDRRSKTYGLPSLNFGICKGLTFDRVLIAPNGPLLDYIMKGKPPDKPEKYYVAVTRAKYSLAFVSTKPPTAFVETTKLEVNGKEFNLYRIK